MEIDSEREDGEIIDGLEEVSDCSITTDIESGKCITYQDLISPVSVSSFSDSVQENLQHSAYYGQKRKIKLPEPKLKRRRKSIQHSRSHHRLKKSTKKYGGSSSDSEDEIVDYKTLRQLKDAIHIGEKRDNYNDLQTRLKKMVAPEIPGLIIDEDPEIAKLRTDALLSSVRNEDVKNNKDELLEVSPVSDEDMELDSNSEEKPDFEVTEDTELIQLRLAALKTAVLKKSEKRKQKRILEANDDMNKENKLESENQELNQNVITEVDRENYVICVSDVDNMEKVDMEIEEFESENKIEELQPSVVDTQPVFVEVINPPSIDVPEKSEDNNSSVEDDVDILRAMLLASVSNKISAKRPALLEEVIPVKTHIVKKNSYQVMSKNNVAKPVSKPNNLLITAPVKPLIIQLNGESDSDTESPDKSENNLDENNGGEKVSENIDKLLKNTRAKFETVQKNYSNKVKTTITSTKTSGTKLPLVGSHENLNVKLPLKDITSEKPLSNHNGFSKSTVIKQNTVTVSLKKSNIQKLGVAISKTIVDKSIDSSINKSVEKYIPASKQLEYRLLKQKLKNANKKRLRKNSHRSSVQTDNTNLNGINRLMSDKIVGVTQAIVTTKNLQEKKKTITQDVNDEVRLQMTGKYKELSSLLKKIDEAKSERKKYGEIVNKLLGQLTEARTKLSKFDEKVKELCHLLLKHKALIDKSAKPPVSKLTKVNVIQTTSTPIKKNTKPIKCDISGIEITTSVNKDKTEQKTIAHPMVKKCNKPLIQSSESKDSNEKVITSDTIQEQTLEIDNKNNVDEEENVEKKEDISINKEDSIKCTNVNIVNNPENKIVCDNKWVDVDLPDYVSPLNNWRSDQSSDPLATLCPYETFGECKDAECTYKHYS